MSDGKRRSRSRSNMKSRARRASPPSAAASLRGGSSRSRESNDVPITHKPELAVALSCLKIDQEIPVELYRAVAEVLIYILRIAEKAR